MTRKQIIKVITTEIRRAKKMHSEWPMPNRKFWRLNSDARVVEAAIVAEEAFEAMQVALNMRPSDPHCGGPKGTQKAYKKELIQAGAMVFRALEGME